MYTVSLLAFLFFFFCLTINHNATSTDTWGRKVNFSQAREVLIVCPSPYSRVGFMVLQALACWKASIKASQRLQSLAVLVISISIMVSS